jgi:hypothetical protein
MCRRWVRCGKLDAVTLGQGGALGFAVHGDTLQAPGIIGQPVSAHGLDAETVVVDIHTFNAGVRASVRWPRHRYQGGSGLPPIVTGAPGGR